jgi:hypothetical protein
MSQKVKNKGQKTVFGKEFSSPLKIAFFGSNF